MLKKDMEKVIDRQKENIRSLEAKEYGYRKQLEALNKDLTEIREREHTLLVKMIESFMSQPFKLQRDEKIIEEGFRPADLRGTSRGYLYQ